MEPSFPLYRRTVCYRILFQGMSSGPRCGLKALNEIAFINCLPQCLAFNECLMNDSYCYFFNKKY